MEVSGKCFETESELCELCKLQSVSTQASGYCGDCDEFMCQKCFQGHLIPRPCRNHTLSSIEQGQTSRTQYRSDSIKCMKHSKQDVRYYCPSHEAVACGDCHVVDHNECKMSFISVLAKNYEDGSEFNEFLQKICHLEKEIKDTDTKLHESINKNTSFAESALNDIRKFRKEINAALDRAEKELLDEVNKKSEENKSRLADIQNKNTTLEHEVADLKNKLDVSQYRGDALFINAVECKPKHLEMQKSLSEIQRSSSVESFIFEPDQRLNNLIGSALKLGSLKAYSQPSVGHMDVKQSTITDKSLGRQEQQVNSKRRAPVKGDRVRRGPDWSLFYGNQDGGGVGTVIEEARYRGRGRVRVKWDFNGSEEFYRMGAEGNYDLEII